MEILALALAAGALALLFAVYLTFQVMRQDPGNEAMQEIGKAIQEGAMAFLRREYMMLAAFVLVLTVIIAVFIDFDILNKTGTDRSIPSTAIAYLAGALASALTGFIGMSIAVRANVRTTAGAMRGLNAGLRIAFNSGSVMGITVVGIASSIVSNRPESIQSVRTAARTAVRRTAAAFIRSMSKDPAMLIGNPPAASAAAQSVRERRRPG